MHFLSGLALVLLALVGYSSGAVLAGHGRRVSPGLLDLGAVIVAWATALGTRSIFGRWTAILIWVVVAGLVAALLTLPRRGSYMSENGPNPKRRGDGPLRRAWERWKSFAAKMGNYQARVMLAFFYFVVVPPFAILAQLLRDPLATKASAGTSSWVERQPVSEDLETAREQS